MALENLIVNFFIIFCLITILTSLVVIFITDNIFVILVLFLGTILSASLIIYSFGSELISYSFVIIYGGGILVLYLIFMLFTGLYLEPNYFSNLITLKVFFIGFISSLIYGGFNYVNIPREFSCYSNPTEQLSYSQSYTS